MRRFYENFCALDHHTCQLTPASALAFFEVVKGTGFVNFGPSAVAFPTRSGLCDPLPSIARPLQSIVGEADALFLGADWKSLPPALRIGISRLDYALLVGAMLQNGKVSLMRQATAAASIFAIGKKDSSKLREIWAWQHISARSARLPAPPRLGNPGVFSRIKNTADGKLYFSKRDAKAFFDQLKLPIDIRPYFWTSVAAVG